MRATRRKMAGTPDLGVAPVLGYNPVGGIGLG